MKSKRFTLAANDVAQAMLANAAEGGSPFAILQPDGFLIPYGEFPHKVGLQIFDRAAADEMVANHGGLLNKMVSWARGQSMSYPVYVGHPDMPGSKDLDKRAYGWIEGMSAENEGLRLSVKWSDAGRELVENAHFKFYSPLWWTKPVKRGVVRPVSLKSMGLTNDPNIPVPALANEQEQGDASMETRAEGEEEEFQNNDDNDMNEILAALGLEVGATPEEVLAKIAELKKPVEEVENAETMTPEEAEKLKADKLAAEAAKAKAEEDATAANEKVVSLEGALMAAANAAVDAAVAAGRVTPADRARRYRLRTTATPYPLLG